MILGTMEYLKNRPFARISETGTFPVPGLDGVRVTYGQDEVVEAVRWLVKRPVLAVDIETEGLGKRAWYLKVVSVAVADHVVLFDPRDLVQYAALQTVINCGADLVLHNSAFDVPPLALNGLITEHTILTRIYDTLLYARMAEPDEKTSRTLAACSALYLGLAGEDTITQRAKNLGVTKSKYFEVVDLTAPAYRWDAATDAVATFRLLPVVREAAYVRQTQGHPFTKYGVTGREARDLVERPQLRNRRYLVRSARGFNWDPEYLDAYRLRQASVRATQEAELATYGIRPGVSQDLIKFLDGIGAVPDGYPRTGTGLMSGAADDLKKLDHPLAKLFVANKKDHKTEDNYLSKVAEMADHNGRIHPSLNVLGASSSGRDSITGVPLHQFDKNARGIIREDFPGAGVVSVDWTQQEAVLAANLAGDVGVLERYEDESLSKKERDVYEIIAGYSGQVRDHSKVTVLASLYGQGGVLLALNLGLITNKEAQAIRAKCQEINPASVGRRSPSGERVPAQRYYPREAAEALGIAGFAKAMTVKDKVWEVMPRTEEFVTKVKGVARQYKCVITWSGRILPVPSAWYDGKYGVIAHKGPNYTIQGGAADMLDETIYQGEKAGLGDTFMFSMHDEVVVQREAAPYWAEIMQRGPERLNWVCGRTTKFRTDVADLGERWGKD